jgi:hypothetical protein
MMQAFYGGAMLQYTHVLPINPAGLVVISKAQLWSGLILRIEAQTEFTVGLDRVDIIERADNQYQRALHFGQYIVQDAVTCVPMHSIEFVTQPLEDSPSGRLLIEIVEQPELGLRFHYTTEFPAPSSEEESKLLEIVKGAYHAADVDVVRVIRELMLKTKH